MRSRRTAYLTFQPSAYSSGMRFPASGMQPMTPESYANPEDEQYGFLGPIVGWYFSRGQDEDEDGPGAVVREYWWLIALSVPVLYYGINKTIDKLEKK